MYGFLDDQCVWEKVIAELMIPRIRDGPTRSRRLQGALEAVCRQLMEDEVSALIGAEHGSVALMLG